MQVKRFINRVNVFFSYFSLLALPFAMLCQSCTDKEQVTRLNEQIDSLRQENSKKEQNFKDMIDFVGVMADGLDSIAKHEEILFYTNKGKEGIYNDKEQMKRNLAMFDSLLFKSKKSPSWLIPWRTGDLSCQNWEPSSLNLAINLKQRASWWHSCAQTLRTARPPSNRFVAGYKPYRQTTTGWKYMCRKVKQPLESSLKWLTNATSRLEQKKSWKVWESFRAGSYREPSLTPPQCVRNYSQR